VGALKKKLRGIYKEQFLRRPIFHQFAEKPPWRNLHKILHDGSSRRRYQPCQIYLNRVRGFDSVEGSNFWISHRKEKSPLTQGLNYRSACDKLDNLRCLHYCALHFALAYMRRAVKKP